MGEYLSITKQLIGLMIMNHDALKIQRAHSVSYVVNIVRHLTWRNSHHMTVLSSASFSCGAMTERFFQTGEGGRERGDGGRE